MKKFGVLFVYLFTALSMLVSLSACANKVNDSKVEATKQPETSQVSEPAPDPMGKYNPPIELKRVIRSSTGQKFNPDESYENNVWTKEIEEVLGIKFKTEWMADSSSNAYETKLNMAIASGDLPDFFYCDYKTFSNVQSAGQLADLTDVYEKYGSEALKEIQKEFPESYESAKVDGKLYAIPETGADPAINSTVLWIRQDWLNKLNLTPPSTFDEFLKIAEAFVTQDPDGNGKNDTYGIGLQKDLYNWLGEMNGITAAFHAYTQENGLWVKDDSGKIVYGSIQPNMRNALLAMQDMYKRGLIDKEFGVKDSNKLVEDINNNKIGMAFGANWNSYWPYNDVVKKDINAVFKPYPVPTSDGKPANVGVAWPVKYYYAVSKNCKNPEAVIKLANLYMKHDNPESVEMGEKFIQKGDIQLYLLSPISVSKIGSEYVTYQGYVDAIKNKDGGANLRIKDKAGFERVMAWIEKGDPEAYGTWGQLGPEGSAGVIKNNYIDQNRIVISELRGSDTPTMVEKKSTLFKMEMEVFTRIIMGAPIEEFDRFVEDWNKIGGDVITEELNKQYGKK